MLMFSEKTAHNSLHRAGRKLSCASLLTHALYGTSVVNTKIVYSCIANFTINDYGHQFNLFIKNCTLQHSTFFFIFLIKNFPNNIVIIIILSFLITLGQSMLCMRIERNSKKSSKRLKICIYILKL